MTLPVGLDLDGRRVVVVGGGPTVVPVVHDLLAARALVDLVAPWVCEDVAALAVRDEIGWHGREYAGCTDLLDAWLVVVGSDDVTTDTAAHTDAERLRTWSVAVPGTSSDTATARLPRTTVATTPDGAVTVATHSPDDLLALDVTRAVALHLETGGVDLRRRSPRPGTGWVALVGGGPGTDDLLTTRGRRLLAAADVVVADRLAPRAVLAHLPATVRVIDVGKEPGRHTVPQEAVNDLLVAEALAGRGVVRLKGGDPYVLGRGGEERLACEAHGIPVEVVPGVTSAVAVPAAAGIPVTHRGVARGFTVVTGHDELPAVPPGTDHTVVLLMGVGRLARSAAALLAAGRPADCPVAVIERGLLPDQRVTVGTLGDIAAAAAVVGVANPAVVVIGDVVRLAPDWDTIVHEVEPAHSERARSTSWSDPLRGRWVGAAVSR
ncbi:uroporphyrinogen-III C-methyltransferase [Oryzobacter telluris]|uniref:uroporphyrinogen-III C-methyltransferase n=1 Tax=Oryzobacter telluris TaxID=3149179 RepID=UPI00370DC3D8